MASATMALATTTFERDLPDAAATDELARELAVLARPGDVIGLFGDLGTGKTTFARAFIHARSATAGGPGDEEVPSPTFTLVQVYDSRDGAVWHFDFYRLTHAEEAYELGIEEAFAEGISLLEWPDRIGGLLPEERLDVELLFAPEPGARRARLIGRGAWSRRLEGITVDA